jgi:hypothetical protein
MIDTRSLLLAIAPPICFVRQSRVDVWSLAMQGPGISQSLIENLRMAGVGLRIEN